MLEWIVFFAVSPPRPLAEVPPSGVERLPRNLGDPTTLFLNFDGAVLRKGCGNDAHFDCSTLSDYFDGYIGPFTGNDTSKAAIFDAVRSDVAELGIIVVGQRPSDDVEYSMVLYGDLGEQQFAGVAPYIDCGNVWPSDTSFAADFHTANTGATVILQEAAHTWGLEHVNASEDILHPVTDGLSPRFLDECFKIVANTDLAESPGSCNIVHEQFCASGFQNSWQELSWMFGPAIPDETAPTLTLETPGADDSFEVTAVVPLRIEVDDDRDPQFYAVTIEMDGEVVYAGDHWDSVEIPLTLIDVAEYALQVEVADESGNHTQLELVITTVPEGTFDAEDDGEGCGIADRSVAPLSLAGLLALRRRRLRPA